MMFDMSLVLASHKPIKDFKSHIDYLIQYNKYYMLNSIITLKPGWKFWGCESPFFVPFYCVLCDKSRIRASAVDYSWLETVVLV